MNPSIGNILARGGDAQFAVLHALGSDQAVRKRLQRGSAPAHHQHLEAIVVIEMDVQRGDDGVEMIVLQFREGLLHMRFVVIIHQRDRAGRIDVAELLLVLHELVGDHVRDRERAVAVAFFPDHFIQLAKQRLAQGNAQPGYTFLLHARIMAYRRAAFNTQDDAGCAAGGRNWAQRQPGIFSSGYCLSITYYEFVIRNTMNQKFVLCIGEFLGGIPATRGKNLKPATLLAAGLLPLLLPQLRAQDTDDAKKKQQAAASALSTPILETEMPEVVVYGRAGDLLGVAATSSEGSIGAEDLKDLPLLRRGELMETVPGLVVTQHSGDGKANQYFLRGFNLDHGTDFAFSIDDIPVNLPTHAHGQGYSDLNFLIPELVESIDYKKGPFYPEVGDFSGAGAANIRLFDTLSQGTFTTELGSYNYVRTLLMDSQKIGAGNLLYAFEYNHYDGPWTTPEHSNRFNGFARYHIVNGDDEVNITAGAYHAQWDSTDQVPQLAIQEGIIGRYGAIDPSDGGNTARYGLSADWTHKDANSTTKLAVYGFYYRLNLFSDFTYALVDPVHGDQFEQVDRRWVAGAQLTRTWDNEWWGKKVENTLGVQMRNDYIPDVGLNHTEDRMVLDVWRKDEVEEFTTGIFAKNEVHWTPWLRSELGLRADLYAVDVNSNVPVNSGNNVDGIVSPKASVIFGPWRKTEFYISAGDGYHSNDARGVTINYDPVTGQPQGKVPLLVRTEGAEAGVRTSAVDGLVSTLSLWYLKSDSELTFDGDSGDTEANGASRRYGIEWANFYKPTPWLTLDADLSLTHARYIQPQESDIGTYGDYIANSIPVVFSSGATVETPMGLFFSARLRYFGSQPIIEDNSVREPASLIFDAKAGYRHNNYEIALEALNLFNSHADDIAYYYTYRLPGQPASGVNGTVIHPAEPFEIRASFTLHF